MQTLICFIEKKCTNKQSEKYFVEQSSYVQHIALYNKA